MSALNSLISLIFSSFIFALCSFIFKRPSRSDFVFPQSDRGLVTMFLQSDEKIIARESLMVNYFGRDASHLHKVGLPVSVNQSFALMWNDKTQF